jgi:transcriptional regulator with XRE-family HTH domain
MTMLSASKPVGFLIREWRKRRRLSQLDLALDAEISTRHLSYVETGRSVPSRQMILHLAEQLEVPLRDRNTLLLAAGYAPAFRERPLDDSELAAARHAVDLVLAAHSPCPALAIDRHWTLIASNSAVPPLLAGVAPTLLSPPVNVLRLSLHPDGLSSRIVNLAQWRAHLLTRLRRQVDLTNDLQLTDLLSELRDYPAPDGAELEIPSQQLIYAGIAIPLQLITDAGTLAFISTTTVFGTPVDITLSELAVETFFPADALTEAALRRAPASLGQLNGRIKNIAPS